MTGTIASQIQRADGRERERWIGPSGRIKEKKYVVYIVYKLIEVGNKTVWFSSLLLTTANGKRRGGEEGERECGLRERKELGFVIWRYRVGVWG